MASYLWLDTHSLMKVWSCCLMDLWAWSNKICEGKNEQRCEKEKEWARASFRAVVTNSHHQVAAGTLPHRFWSRLRHRQRRKKEKCGHAHTCELLPQQILRNLAGLQICPSLILTNIFYFSHFTTIVWHNELISKSKTVPICILAHAAHQRHGSPPTLYHWCLNTRSQFLFSMSVNKNISAQTYTQNDTR